MNCSTTDATGNEVILGPARITKLVVIFLLALTIPPLEGQRITSLRAHVDLRKDGSALISETDTVQGSSLLHRSIPLQIIGGGMNSWNREIKLLSVRDDSGYPLPYEAGVRHEHFIIKVPLQGATAEHTTVLLTYEVRHSIVIYWEAQSAWFDFSFTDNRDWPVPFDRVLVTATVPGDPRGGLQAGLNNSGEPSSVAIDGRTARLSREEIPAGHSVTLWLGFPSAIISLPAHEWFDQEAVRAVFAMVFLLALVAAYMWYKRSIEADINAAVPDYSHISLIPPPSPSATAAKPEKAGRES